MKEQEVVQEALTILLANMQPFKVARCLSAWQVGKGNYLTLKEQLFVSETVASLFEQIQAVIELFKPPVIRMNILLL